MMNREVEISPLRSPSNRVQVAFVLEQHLGHRTFAENLCAAVATDGGVESVWIPVNYGSTGGRLERVPMPSMLRSTTRARAEIAAGLSATSADVVVYNTQVPAVIGGRRARSRPYVLITDITPCQLDRMADEYGHDADAHAITRWAKHSWNRHVFHGALLTVAWSSWVQQSLVEDYGLDVARTTVIPPGVDTRYWTPSEPDRSRPLRILFVGGDFVRKGGPDLLRAFADLPEGEAELVLVTKSASDVPAGVTVVTDLGPNDPRLRDLYRSSDVFVLPSRGEAFGIAAVEASACGLPVLASTSGGLTDIVAHGETGYTFDPGDSDTLARRLRELLDSPDVRRRLGAAARRRAVERFDSNANGARLIAAVRDVVG